MKIDPNEVPLVEVVDAWEVFIAKSGTHTGVLERPSRAQLHDVFGTHKFEDIFTFMSQHGHLHSIGKHTALTNEEKG